jgi:lipoate-protein ligase A
LEPLELLSEAVPGRPSLDTAVSRALLHEVAEGARPACLRLYRPDDALAFSVLDRTRPGFESALALARERGFTPLLRLAGGQAAVFHRQTLAFSWSRPVAELRDGVEARYEEIAAILVSALQRLGVDARTGELPGEYCPGRFSVNAGGRVKLAGVGQRVIRGAAHVGGVLVVTDADRVADVLGPVYDALGLALDPATVGSVADEVPDVGWERVLDAVRQAFADRYALRPVRLGAATLDRARTLAPEHDPDSTVARARADRVRALRGTAKGVEESSSAR